MSDTLRLLIADDEEIARRLLRRYAKKHRELEVIGECRDAGELATALEQTTADVLLLDVQMPGPDVFSVLAARRANGTLPLVIFTTAYDAYAVRAFEMNAIDYLLKPFSEERFAAAMERAKERKQAPAAEHDLARLLRDLGPRPDRLLVPHRDGMVSVAVSDIIWIKSEEDYARIHTPGRNYLVTRTLNELEQRLDPMQFLRVHRSAIVQTGKIREVKPVGSARFSITLEDGTTLIVSRTRAAQLKRWML